jgi:hypothetical protein
MKEKAEASAEPIAESGAKFKKASTVSSSCPGAE